MSNPTGKGGFKNHPENAIHTGRPLGSKSVTSEIRKLLSEEEFAKLIVNLILGGDIKTTLHAYDHLDGKAIQKQIHIGEEERPVRLIIEDERKKNGKAED